MFQRFIAFSILSLCTSCAAICPPCDILESRRWFKSYYQEKCVFSNYHQKWEDKNCKFRIIKVDPDVKFYPLEENSKEAS